MRYLVIGAGGHAQEVAWALSLQCGPASTRVDFFDDRVPPGPLPSGLGDVVGPIDAVHDVPADEPATLVLGVGLPRTKRQLVWRLGDVRRPWATVVHPRATIGPAVALGEGTYVAAGAIVTVNVRVGRFATINMHAQLAHDDVVGDWASLHPDAHCAGDVVVEEGAELGTGAVVVPGGRIGAWSVVGAGAVVVTPVAAQSTVVGVPARPHAGRRRRIFGVVEERR